MIKIKKIFQNKVYEELESIIGSGDRRIRMSDVSEMQYLDRVVKESLRLYPSVPIVSRKTTTPFKIGE